jgi:hypothetical protein
MFRSTFDGKPIFDIPYKIDTSSRRESSLPQGISKNFLVFLGCSFVFGTGVQDHETLPSVVQDEINNVRVYNYGVAASGPVDVLKRLENISSEELGEKKGLFIYVFPSFHLHRLYDSPEFIAYSGGRKVIYDGEENGFKPLGRYDLVHPVKIWIYRKIFYSSIYRLLRPSLSKALPDPGELGPVLKAMKKEANKRSGQFVVLIWPGTDMGSGLKDVLDKESINYLDYSKLDLQQLTNGKATIPIDGHPSPEAHRVLGQKLAQDLPKSLSH